MREVRLTLFPDSLEYRFAAPPGRSRGEPVPAGQLAARLRSIDAASCQRLVLSGGSPLAHPRFASLLAECRRLGFKRIALETTASPLARPGAVEALARLGLSELVLFLGGLGEGAHDAALREKGALSPALRGLAEAVGRAGDGGPRVYVALPLIRATAAGAEPLLVHAASLPGRLAGFLLSLPEPARVPREARAALLPYGEQADVASRVFRAAHARGLEHGFTNRRGILPCGAAEVPAEFGTVFHERFRYLQHAPADSDAEGGGGEEFVRVSACAACTLAATCRGAERAYVETFGEAGLLPVPLDVAMGWKLRRMNTLEESDYRNVSQFRNDSAVNPRGLVRINGRCNMSCSFCFVDHSAPDFDLDGLKREAEQMARTGTRHFVVSGGEPTLHPGLPELVRFARSLGAFDVVEMQTNGVRCSDEAYAAELVEAGLNRVTVSLHCVDPEHSDRITRFPGGFARTLKAMHNFRRAGVVTQVAFVITRENFRELPETVRFLRREFPPSGGSLGICLAVAQGISDLVLPWVIPSFTEIKPFVVDALDFCLENGIGFGGMIGQGGYPPCMLDGAVRFYDGGTLDQVFRSPNCAEEFYKAERCRECSFDPFCLGPRRSYVRHYGDAEIRPFTAPLRRSPRAGLSPDPPAPSPAPEQP